MPPLAHRLLDHAGADEEVLGAHRGDHEVGEREVAREAVPGHRHPAQLARHVDRAIEGPVRDHDRADPLSEELPCRQLTHRAGAEEERAPVLEAVEDAARQLDRGRADRDRPLGDPGLAPDALRNRERLVEAPVEDLTRRSHRRGRRVLVLHLAEDLRLADHHRVEAGSDPEEMPDSLAPGVPIEVGGEERLGHRVIAREEARERGADRLGIRAAGDHLDPIAGREDRALRHPFHLDQPPERRLELPVAEREAFAHLHGGAPVVQADDDDAPGGLDGGVHVRTPCHAGRGRARSRPRARSRSRRSRLW